MIEERKIDWTAQWREEGLREGRQEGRRIGRREGRQEGRREGRREGQREGEAEGRRKGEAELLLRQLTRMYGPMAPAIQDRVRRAQAAQLLDWGERLVTSGSLDEVFGRDRDD